MSGSVNTNSRFLVAVVDDEESVCEALESLLKSVGFRVATFTSARDFLNFAQLPSISCAILDVYMPNMDGIALQDHLIATRPMPIIFITAHASSALEQQVKRAGAICVLSKPFSDDVLLGCLNSALGLRGLVQSGSV